MAHAVEDRRRPGTYTARFRGFLRQGRGGTVQAVVPRERLRAGYEAADANAYAIECDQACRLLEVARTVANITRARDLKAISAAQAEQLLLGRPTPGNAGGVAALAPLTIMEAARAHPSSQRESLDSVDEAIRHERELNAFMAWAKVRLVAEVTLDQVMAYVLHLTKVTKLSWDGRRHALLWIRRATRMGATRGLPDVLGRLKLDSRPPVLRSLALTHWSLAELARGAVAADDLRLRVAIGLGGFVGLRPSEIIDVEIPDLTDGLLRVGRKNLASQRLLPLPELLLEWMRELAGKRKSGRLIRPTGNRTDGAGFGKHTFYAWFVPRMGKACGKKLGPKFLRKSFATWCFRERDLPPQHVEAYLGHKTALASMVTGRHYLADLVAHELLPSRAVIERVISAALDQARADLRDREVASGSRKSQVAS